MRIGFVLPPSVFLLDDRAFLYGGPLQIAALARQQGHEVEVFDATGHMRRCTKGGHLNPECETEAMTHAVVGTVMLGARVDLLCFYSLAAQHSTVVRMMRAARAARRDLVCALGGPHASTAPTKCLADGFDYVVTSDQGGGGGEPGFLELVRRCAAEGGAPAAKPRGLPVAPAAGHGCGGNGHGDPRIISVPSRAPSARTNEYVNDGWPWPARDLVDVASYRYFCDGRRILHFLQSTGCSFSCSFCSHFGEYTKMGLRSPGNVQAEFDEVRRAYPWCGGMMDYSDEVNLRFDFASEYLPMLAFYHRRHGWIWRAFWKSGRKWNTTDDLFRACALAGFKQLCSGIESGSPVLLKGIKKGASREDNLNFVRFCVRYGIRPKCFFQVGLGGWLPDGTPVWETPATIEETRRFLIEAAAEGLRDLDVAITTPYEGTPLRDTPQAQDPRRPQQGENPLIFDPEEIDRIERADVLNYKGRPGEYTAYVATPDLTREDLVQAREYLDREFARASGQKLEEVTLVKTAGGEEVTRIVHDDG